MAGAATFGRALFETALQKITTLPCPSERSGGLVTRQFAGFVAPSLLFAFLEKWHKKQGMCCESIC